MAKNPKAVNEKLLKEAQKKLAVKLIEQQNKKSARGGHETERRMSRGKSSARGKESARRNKSSSEYRPRQDKSRSVSKSARSSNDAYQKL